MQILLALIAGAVIGTAAHFALPGRDTRGAVLLPVLGTLAGGVVWMILTWIGWGLDNPLLWLAAFVVPIVVVWPTGILLTRARDAHDARERTRLRIG